jgi:hypothetical protein
LPVCEKHAAIRLFPTTALESNPQSTIRFALKGGLYVAEG